MRGESLKGSARFSGGSMKGRGVNQRSSEAAAKSEAPKQAEPPKQEAMKQQAPPSESPPKLGLEVNEEKGKIKGLVQPREVDGKKLVDLGPLGSMVAPAPGGTDSYLMGLDKLLVLKSKNDGAVEVYTRTLGIEGDKEGGFRGDLLPADGEVEFAGHQLEVGHLKPGQERSEKLEIKGKKYKVKLRMNEDGSVTVSGERKRSFLSQVAGFVGKIAPILAAIPGLGLAAVAAKVVTGFNAVKDFVNSAKSGNLLGMVSSAAGAFVGVSQGAAQAIASKVANFANLGQQVIDTVKHGLGKGLLQVVSNGANLVSGLARAGGDLGQGDFQKGAYGFAGTAGQVAGFASSADSASKGNLLPAITQGLQQVASKFGETQKASGSEGKHSVQGGTRLTPFDSSKLPADPTLESARFGGFTRSPGLDAFVGSRGTNEVLGGEVSDFLLAQATQLTPQQEHLHKNGSQNLSAEQLATAIRVVDTLIAGGTFSSFQKDSVVTREELATVSETLKNAIRRNDYLSLQINDLNSLGHDPKTFYTDVVAALDWMSANYSAFAAQNPITSFKVGPATIDITNSQGRRQMLDIEDVKELESKGLLKPTTGGFNFQKMMDDFIGYAEDLKRSTLEAKEANRQSGGSNQVAEKTFNGRQYANPADDVRQDGNPYTVYKQVNVAPGEPRYELLWTPVPTDLIPNGGFAEFPLE